MDKTDVNTEMHNLARLAGLAEDVLRREAWKEAAELLEEIRKRSERLHQEARGRIRHT